MCAPLADALISGLNRRFSSQLEHQNFILASAFNPQFKLTWVQESGKKEAISKKMVAILDSAAAADKSQEQLNRSGDDDNDFDNFFKELSQTGTTQANQNERIIFNFLQCKVCPISKNMPSELVPHFISYNTPIPSSAAVERLFSLGKDILKPKRAGLSDNHFEMLVFLKGNKRL